MSDNHALNHELLDQLRALHFQERCVGCFGEAKHPTMLPLRVPSAYPRDAATFVTAFLKNGEARLCLECGPLKATFKQNALIPRLVQYVQARAGGALHGDMLGIYLLAAILDYAWAESAMNGRTETATSLAACLEILERFPMLPLGPTDSPGVLNLVTRDIGRGVYAGIAPMSQTEVYIIDFGSNDRGKGNGRWAMQELCEIANRHRAALCGVISSHTNRDGIGRVLSDTELEQWYGSFGFIRAAAAPFGDRPVWVRACVR